MLKVTRLLAALALLIAAPSFAASPVTITGPNGTQAGVDANGSAVEVKNVGSGAIASGAGADGWNVTEGTKADSAWVSGSGSIVAIAKTIANNTGAAIPAGTNTIGGVFSVVPSAGSGTALACNAQIKATATACGTSATHNLIGWSLDNTLNSAASYVQFFNLATGSVTLGVTTPAFVVGLPANGGSNFPFPVPMGFSTALTYACTTTPTGSTAPSSNCNITLFYN